MNHTPADRERRCADLSSCRAKPRTQKKTNILSFARYTMCGPVSGHAQDIWVPPATCRTCFTFFVFLLQLIARGPTDMK